MGRKKSLVSGVFPAHVASTACRGSSSLKTSALVALVASALVLAPLAAPGVDALASGAAGDVTTSEIGALIGGKWGTYGAVVGGVVGGTAGFFGGAYLGSLAGPGAIFVGLKGADIGAGVGAIVGGG